MPAPTVTIPNRPVFRAQEVCELAEVQPFVLRTWEAEFPELGVAKSPTSPRVYRRADVERVLRIKQLVFVDGLTLSGARRRLSEEGFGGVEADAGVADADVAAMIDGETRQQLRDVRRGLQWILGVLSGEGLTPVDFVLRVEPAVPARPAAKPKAVVPSRSAARAGVKDARRAHPTRSKPRAKTVKRKR
jgi:DNA-binding transcriptional MerR regulator